VRDSLKDRSKREQISLDHHHMNHRYYHKCVKTISKLDLELVKHLNHENITHKQKKYVNERTRPVSDNEQI
jgi:hypothetical protein